MRAMANAVHLDSSLTFVPASMLKQGPKNVIGSEVFESEDQHLILRDSKLANSIRDFAMRDGLAITKIPVGAADNNTPVEFFWLDVKKNKKEVAKLAKLLGRRWLEVVQKSELAREEADGNLLSTEVTAAIEAVENMIDLRRFIVNGTNGSVLSKKKRAILLFHHSLANAPVPA